MWRPILLMSLAAAVIVFSYVFGIGEKLAALRDWIQSLGALGPVVFVFIYAAATTAALPGLAITIVAGAIFGSVAGVIVVSIGSTLGASLAFLIARYFARDATAKWLAKREKFKKLDDLTEKHGAVIVAIVRLVPLFPFNFVNYGFGITRVPFWTYVVWSWLCMLPATILYVVGTDAVIQAIVRKEVPWTLVGVMIAVGVILVVLVRFARKRLHDEEEEMPHEAADTDSDTSHAPSQKDT
jgi:uncharacterized membrane protein YdjX (TVP38/TMEM64 family)